MEIKQLFLTENDCYREHQIIVPAGIVVHSTGANNKNLRRYIGPDDGIIGQNLYGNHWNQSGITKCVNAMIGEDKNGVLRCYQTLPWTYHPWGCGSGSKGSYNSSHIQFEICEDSLQDQTYFEEAFTMAVELCTYLCKEYNLKADSVVSHHEAHMRGYASNHADYDYWLAKFGKTMDDFRKMVHAKLREAEEEAENGRGPVLPILAQGSQGKTVTVLQRLLIAEGCGPDPFREDSFYGAGTKQAVQEYQRKEKLAEDGIVGNATWSRLLGIR